MKNTFGSTLSVTLFGESHGDYIGATLDGLAPGIRIDREFIASELKKRRPSGKISTGRIEADEYTIVSGVYGEYTTGTPLTVLIPNTNKRSADYEANARIPRPSHADYTAECKYHGFADPRGGGHFSGRLTAPLVLVGAIVRRALMDKGIFIGTHIKSLHGKEDRELGDIRADIEYLNTTEYPVLDTMAKEKMIALTEECRESRDSIGGVLETYAIGIPEGVGEPWFDTVEGCLAHAMFSIPAIKGVEFGCGFGFGNLYGSEANDQLEYRDGKVVTKTNNSGGINGGITNGMPIVMRCAVKPTPSIFKEQDSVDLDKGENVTLSISGRHDPSIIHRARAVVDAMTALTLADLLCVRYGTDYLR